MHAKNIKLYHTAGICKLCHQLSDAQKSCINKYSALQCAWIILRYERLSEIQSFLDADRLKTWRCKFLCRLQRNKNTTLQSSAKATKSIEKLITSIPLLPYTNSVNKDNSPGQQQLQRLTDTTLTGSIVSKHRTKQVQHFFTQNFLINSNPLASPAQEDIYHWLSLDKIKKGSSAKLCGFASLVSAEPHIIRSHSLPPSSHLPSSNAAVKYLCHFFFLAQVLSHFLRAAD